MKVFKNIDITLQVTVMLYMLLGMILDWPGFYFGIFILGFIQLTSALIHLAWRNKSWISKLRKIYFWLLLLPLGGFIVAIMQQSKDKYKMGGLLEMMFVLAISLLLALFYLVISFIELRRLIKLS